MLQKLYIKNYAIIDELEIQFHPHLTVLTGETGAGKSIILGALSLILGERADTSILIDKENKCIIEAVFATRDNNAVNSFLTKAELDVEAETHIRREISATGKSRAFINDTPVNLAELQELGGLLVDLNRQFDNRLLHQSAFQYEVMDSFSGNMDMIGEYRRVLQIYQEQNTQLQSLKEAEMKASSESEYLQFVFDELQEADFSAQEIEVLEEKVKAAQHQEEIARVLSATTFSLSGSEENLVGQIRKLIQDLQSIVHYHPAPEGICNRLNSVMEELKDIASETDSMNSHLSFDQGDLSTWMERMDLGFRLMKKHNVASTEDLLHFKNDLERRLATYESLASDIAELNKDIEQSLHDLERLSRHLWENRKKVIPQIVKNLEMTLARIGMANVRIKIELQASENFNQFGKDELDFLMDANQSGHFNPMAKVASGGELSRLLLAIKSLVSGNLSLPTLIFDEVDAAISGEAAKQVSVLMQSLAQKHQVIVLTHQAQMAAKGDLHLFIFKEPSGDAGRIQTKVKVLSPEERVGKIAQMIGGLEPGPAAVKSAEELLSPED